MYYINYLEKRYIKRNEMLELDRALKKIQLKLFKLFPKIMIKLYYRKFIGSGLDIKNPKLFSEKIQWLKFYYARDPLALLAGDKAGLHKYLQDENLSFLSVPLLGVYETTSEIIWDKLPNQFVMKKSNSSGMNIIVTNKQSVNKDDIFEKMNQWMNEEFGVFGGEIHYSKMESRIVIEGFLTEITKDWRIFCLNGEPEMIQVSHWDEQVEDNYSGHRDSIITYTRLDGEIMYVDGLSKKKNSNFIKGNYIELPEDFDKMLEYSKLISKNFPMVRVDFFHSEGRLYIGELTFTPSSGFRKMTDEIQIEFGEKLNLPKGNI